MLPCKPGGELDPFSAQERRRVMQAVRRNGTEPERRLRRALWGAKLRYRLRRQIAGARPDLCFVGTKVAVFVDGCFWHGCPEHYSAPAHNAGFWKEKLRKNRARDQRDNERLKAAGWNVLRYWECEVRKDAMKIVEVVEERVRGPVRDSGQGGDGAPERHG